MFKAYSFLMILVLASACSSEKGQLPAVQEVVSDTNLIIGSPVAFKNLTLFPLYQKEEVPVEVDYLTLEEGLDRKKVKVSEVGTGADETQIQILGNNSMGNNSMGNNAGTVNAVEIDNQSDRTLYILAGQVILGGKQDRAITTDTIVPPGEKLLAEVCCVEQGRWSTLATTADGYSLNDFSVAADAPVQSNIKQILQSKGEAGQTEVWSNVEVANAAYCLDNPTSTYKEIIKHTKKDVDACMAALRNKLDPEKKPCGFVACVNGKVVTCDIFASSRLMEKFSDSLIRGYTLDALSLGTEEGMPQVKPEAVHEFLDELYGARENGELLAENKHRRVEKLETSGLIGFGNMQQLESLGYLGGDVHISAYNKDD